jgi:hypothetical protein
VISGAPGLPGFWDAWLTAPSSARLQRNKESREAQRPAVEDADAQGPADTIKAALEWIKASQTGLAATRQRHYQAK